MPRIVLDDVTMRYPDGPTAIDHLSLDVEPGELFGIVGPSGCGKTTALRVIAGFERPTAGRVLIGDRDVTNVETRHRDLGLISQTNLLMNHRTARGNIRFPLEMRAEEGAGAPGDRVMSEAGNLRVRHLLDRRPKTLSEGERRAVQLARAVISAPATLLMDEPLAYLEDQIRFQLRGDVMRIHRDRGLTTLLVTANQTDAMAMCDRVAVLFDGVVHQVGQPLDVYRSPATTEVAAFFGEPSMNIMPADVHVSGSHRRLEVLGCSIPAWAPVLDDYAGSQVLVGIRAEDLAVGVPADNSIEARIATTEPLGHQTLAQAETSDQRRLRLVLQGAPPPRGTVLDVAIPADRMHLFDPETGLAMLHPSGP